MLSNGQLEGVIDLCEPINYLDQTVRIGTRNICNDLTFNGEYGARRVFW